ncbi:cbb3-type cytochrome oxidase assembly protein CcoS [Pseudotabrizicola sediminis]|uniref:Cbb3-type cytochrome oxidase assembly protein CcoS n=1 Tax=Pseudotabrizicola sediminis TaxID=2486418 RepID=A0ABY2KJ92_9RHOB|nr:cbb3-type cytochrome oxidase assembly protein CcoS [Pseudotabrizicola sediminis]TGD42468.1 cbb3-type cytochrome oxidase assembly protein CcoS [Pseudotabrizicola sediminis]
MSYLFLIPVSITLGLTGLGAFFWAMRHNQYEDLDGAAARILTTPDQPLSPPESLRNSHDKTDAD